MNFDLYDLVAHLAEEKEPGVYDIEDEDSLEEFISDYYGIDIENFENLMRDLLPLCTVAQSPLTDLWYRGFGTENIWLLSKRIEK